LGKKLPYTPNSRIKSALRNLWLRSRERASALKRDKYTCQICGRKQTRATDKERVLVEVHHRDNIDNWNEIVEIIRAKLLCDPELLQTLCIDCHKEIDNEMP